MVYFFHLTVPTPVVVPTFEKNHSDKGEFNAQKRYGRRFPTIKNVVASGMNFPPDSNANLLRSDISPQTIFGLLKSSIIIQLEDFSRPKIIWKRIGSILRFSFDKKGCLGLDSTCFAAGEHIGYLCCVLNSLMGHYLLKDSPKTGTGDLLVSVQAIEPACIPYNAQYDSQLSSLLDMQISNPSDATEKEINNIVFTMYGLTPNEREYVTQYIKQSQQSL